ncbi:MULTISPECIES: peptidoglycan meso-diaminopimelic acid protein amidase [Brenneria]|uniref:Transpeptidase n=1 Tax=Brenneria nigrifluens DSM 30175 = ATCC 13028 TaxID=1121120 RepID=A0A2U1UK35_9GAMM|nr:MULTISPECIES: peptidoglycan meso-diaminopimelic acid protein amidase [Brenneria]EHD20365.1 ErfK/YbiS/YcfS/YnhG family protein [Brenneria sp. EniD312]PWC22046.1 transpeptidase [Brenneria nigrifluens] [Brenneria nigrifluens DSM 30175 = ATCC 13028]QCR03573.1 transpeptidase [Brenneria nigrifluens] [Brenneria nigrifluens DSM 30175 = ATCC 13028]
MQKIALSFAMLFFLPSFAVTSAASEPAPLTPIKKELKQQLLGSPIYIQIFKEERLLELYAKVGNEYRLLEHYPICKYSGGLGPKRREGDLKSPEGFYQVDLRQLKPDSRYYRAINIGFPNEYDQSQGYSGRYLMIHGECVSVGCYAMTNNYMEEIYRFAEHALLNGQTKINLAIYPFRMTEHNMQRHRNSSYYSFWRQLQPAYSYFNQHYQPPAITVFNGQYVVSPPLMTSQPISNYAFTETK